MQSARARQRWIFFSFTLLEESQVYLRRPFFFPSVRQSVSFFYRSRRFITKVAGVVEPILSRCSRTCSYGSASQPANQSTLFIVYVASLQQCQFFVCCPAPPEITTTTTTREPYGSLRITVTTVTPSTPPPLSYIVSQTSWAMNVLDSYGFFFKPLPLMAEIISVFRICKV